MEGMETKEINLIPLSRASLCVNCDVISDSKTNICPACGSKGLLPLHKTTLMGRQEGESDLPAA